MASREILGMLFHMTERDFEQNPYSPDEVRAAEFIAEYLGIGGGDDPIGFLMMSMLQMNRQLQHHARYVVGAREGQHIHHIDGDITNNDPSNLRVIDHDEHRNIEMEGEASA